MMVTEDLVVKEISNEQKNGVLSWCLRNWRAIVAEIVSTSTMIFFGCLTCMPIDGLAINPPMYGPMGFGCVVALNIKTFGHISGAHMNPAVTFAAVIWGKMSIVLGISYVIAQVSGAIMGYGMLVLLSPSNLSTAVCVTQPIVHYTEYQALGIEILLTAGLVLINCAVWDPMNALSNESNPIIFGLVILGLSLSGGPLTGASMNPARSLAPAIWTNIWNAHWVYWAGPLVGSLLATILYKYIWFLRPKIDDPEVLTWMGSRCQMN